LANRALSALRVNKHRRFSRFREKFEESEPGRTTASGQLAAAGSKICSGIADFRLEAVNIEVESIFDFHFRPNNQPLEIRAHEGRDIKE